MKVQLKHQTFQ